MDVKPFGSGRDIAAAVGQDPVDVFPFDPTQRRGIYVHRGRDGSFFLISGKCRQYFIGISRFGQIVDRSQPDRFGCGGNAAIAGEDYDLEGGIDKLTKKLFHKGIKINLNEFDSEGKAIMGGLYGLAISKDSPINFENLKHRWKTLYTVYSLL